MYPPCEEPIESVCKDLEGDAVNYLSIAFKKTICYCIALAAHRGPVASWYASQCFTELSPKPVRIK